MTDSPFDRAALRAYIARHKLKLSAMATHAGIPYRTLRGTLAGREPSWMTRGAIEWALRFPPPARPLPAHGKAIAAAWPYSGGPEIARRLGISHQRVYFIAKTMGLPPKRMLRPGAITDSDKQWADGVIATLESKIGD